MPAEHPNKVGPYEIVSLVGEGAMGIVYKAIEPVRGELVAIKVLRPQFLEDEEAVERFHREAEAVSRLRHRNLVRILDKAERDGHVYFVMEYVAGTTLESVLRRRRLSLREAFIVFKRVCAGLEAAHGEGIVHRDLSPRNILVSEDLETVKIVDFGISRVESISKELGTLSTNQVSLGTLHYMAPEQAIDMRQTDHRADIYSLGVLFYEMLTGRVPVGRYSLPSAVNSEVPSDVDPVVLRCLETSPGDRFASVAQLAKRIQRLDNQLRLGLVSEIQDFHRSTSKILLKPKRSAALKWGLTAAALVVAVVASAYLLSQRRSASAEDGSAAEAAGAAGAAAGAVVSEVDAARRDEAPPREAPPLDLDAVSPPTEEGGSEPTPGAASDSAPARADARGSSPAASGRADLEAARARADAGQLEGALSDLRALIDRGGAAPVIASALLLAGELHDRAGDGAAAREAWAELGRRFGDTEAAAEASYRTAAAELREKARDDPRAVWRAYNETIAGHPRSVWAARALMDRADLEKDHKWRVDDAELGTKVPMALITYRQMIKAFPRAANADQAFFELAEMYEDLKRFDLAAATFESLATRFPDDRRDAWWRLAQLYDSRRLNDRDKAVSAYEKVPRSSPNYTAAQRRVGRLRR